MNLLSGGKLELLPDLFRAMTRCCLIDGECYIATEVGTQKIVGTACWFPPGKQVWATYVSYFLRTVQRPKSHIRRDEIRQATGFDTFFGKLDQVAKDWWINEASFLVLSFASYAR
jgi:hypothetical protein